MTLGVKLGDKTSPRISTIIGVTIMISSYLILIFFKNYYLVLLGMGIFGLGDGLGNLSAIKNAWKYFPNNKGLVNGIIIGGLGLSSSFFTPLADFIINKEGVKTGDDGFYSKDIADRLIYFLYAMIGIFAFLGFQPHRRGRRHHRGRQGGAGACALRAQDRGGSRDARHGARGRGGRRRHHHARQHGPGHHALGDRAHQRSRRG